MTEKYFIAPHGAAPSPDVSQEINAVFAVLLAHSIGYLDPLLARLRNPAVDLEPIEREFLADVLAGGIRRPRGGYNSWSVQAKRKQLEMAATYAELVFQEEPSRRGQKAAAEREVAKKYGVEESEVRRNVRQAKKVRYGLWGWWDDIAVHLAKKGPRKRESLHLTY